MEKKTSVMCRIINWNLLIFQTINCDMKGESKHIPHFVCVQWICFMDHLISVHSCSVPVTTNLPPPYPMLHPLTIKSPKRKRSLFQAQSRSSPILFVILPRVENWCQTIRLFACCTTIGYDNFIQLHNKDSVCMLHNQYNENL